MKLRFPLLFLLIFASGCTVSSTIIPSGQQVAEIKQVHVVAMEAPPLILPSAYQAKISHSSDLRFFPPGARALGPQVGMAIVVANTIPIFWQLTETSHRSYDALRSSNTVLPSRGIWTPTVVLANEVSDQLTANGIVAKNVPGVKPIPGVDFRGVTTHMENWLAPIRSYYNYAGPVESYRDLASVQSLFVLEVSISNYEVFDEKLFVQVHLKLIDPRDRQVVGRVRASDVGNMPSVEPLDQVLANDASRFKEIFSETGRRLVGKSLIELGLLRPAD